MKRYTFWAELALVMLVLVIAPKLGLLQDDNCPEVVQQALADLGNNCANLGRDSACYGFNRVGATFSQDVAEDFFTKPSDRADLVSVQSIQTAPLDSALEEWGLAVLSLRANIPNTLPGQAVRFILLGDTSIQNDVPPEEAEQQNVDPITVTTTTAANIRSAPTTRANVISSVPSGTSLTTNALSTDDEWIQVVFGESLTGWVSRALVQTDGDLDTLPNAEDAPRSPMQAFHFQTGIGELSCTEAPSLLVAQGPQNLAVNITANGAEITIGSTIVLETTDNTLRLMTIHGVAQVGNLRIPAGYTAQADLSDEGNVDGNFGGFRALTKSELDDLQILEDIPDSVLNYPIQVPDRPPQTTTTTNASGTPSASGSGLAQCASLKPTSPLDGLAYGYNTFYWDPAPGATSYRLTVIGVGSAETSNTNTVLDLSPAGFNLQMSWYVEALVNGVVACTSATVTVPRESNPPPFSGSLACGPGDNKFTVNYQNAPSGSTSVTAYNSFTESSISNGVPPLNGSMTFDYPNGSVTLTANPSGQTLGLGTIYCGSD